MSGDGRALGTRAIDEGSPSSELIERYRKEGGARLSDGSFRLSRSQRYPASASRRALAGLEIAVPLSLMRSG